MENIQESKIQSISKGNDLLRITLHSFLGKVVMSRSVALHPDREKILDAVRTFKDFNESNDPYGEHDCASFDITTNLKTESFRFKIDYYDLNYEFGANPYSDPFKRLLTIMRSSDY